MRIFTPDYAAIPSEMKSVAACFGKEVLREVEPAAFFEKLPELRGKVSDRALLRAIHFFGDNDRVPLQVAALRRGDFDTLQGACGGIGEFFQYVFAERVFLRASGEAGNLPGLGHLPAASEPRKGAWRVHGGGFAGTVQAFVPADFTQEFRTVMEKVFGKASCYTLAVRPVGGVQIF